MGPATRRKVRAAAIGSFLLLMALLGLPSRPVQASGALETYLSGLNWPVALAFAPDGRIFFAEAFTGQIRIVKYGALLPTPFFTLDHTATYVEQGVLGLALDPQFPVHPWVYAYHTFNDTANGTVYNRIVRIRANGDAGVALEVLLHRIPAGDIHNGGPIAFGPDGKLYASAGDASDLREGPVRSQDLLSLGGKILRMNPDGTVPTDNPFYGNASANPYVYTYGHRNVFGVAFHPLTGRVFVTENGPDCNDEVNLLIPGRNYGWGPNETCAEPPPPPYNTNQDGPNPVLPLTWYTPTIAPTNAIIPNGPTFAAFQNDLIMGDYNTGNLRHLTLERPNYDRVINQSIILHVPEGILDVESGLDGAIWFTTQSTIYRYVDTTPGPRASFSAVPNPTNPGVPVTFNASASVDPDGTIVSYVWDFGDGATGSGVVAAHTYSATGNYTVALTVTDSASRSVNATGRIEVNTVPLPPFASFTATPNPVNPSDPVTFDASASVDTGGTIVSYDWDFGDGSRGSGEVVAHAYAAPGTYPAVLSIKDNNGMSATAVRQVRVNHPPLASFTVAPAEAFIGVVITFDATPSSDPDGAIVSYAWDFGDGSSTVGVRVTHAYPEKGIFPVTLVVRDDLGLTARSMQSVLIGDRPPSIRSAIPDAGAVALQPGERRTFFVDAADSDGDSLAYVWRVNGAIVGGNSSTFEFNETVPGIYLVNVTVSDGSLQTWHEWTVTVGLSSVGVAGFPWTPVAVILAVAIAGVASFLVLHRIRRKAKGA